MVVVQTSGGFGRVQRLGDEKQEETKRAAAVEPHTAPSAASRIFRTGLLVQAFRFRNGVHLTCIAGHLAACGTSSTAGGQNSLGPPSFCDASTSDPLPLLAFFSDSLHVSPLPIFVCHLVYYIHTVRLSFAALGPATPHAFVCCSRNFLRSCWTICAPAPSLPWYGKGRTSSPADAR